MTEPNKLENQTPNIDTATLWRAVQKAHKKCRLVVTPFGTLEMWPQPVLTTSTLLRNRNDIVTY